MIDTDRQPEDSYAGPGIDPDALERIARSSMAVTGIPQRIHAHAEGAGRCGPGCRIPES